jgi:hypothetical protein
MIKIKKMSTAMVMVKAERRWAMIARPNSSISGEMLGISPKPMVKSRAKLR